MSSTFDESEAEKMVIAACEENGWKYRTPEQYVRPQNSILVECVLRDALVRLNPCLAGRPENVDTVIYRLRALISSVQPHDLVTQNERFKKFVFEENSFPFGKDGRSVSIRFFDYDNVGNNEFAVMNQWVYPQVEGGKRLDVVLPINGIAVVVGEMKTPTRPSISWMDGVKDLSDYEKSIPKMFVTNFFNFACDGKSFRYGALCAPITAWGPWYAGIPHEEGTLSAVKASVLSMLKPGTVLDLFRYFTLFSTDKRNRTIKVVCRYQQYEGANMIMDRAGAGAPKKRLIWRFQG